MQHHNITSIQHGGIIDSSLHLLPTENQILRAREIHEIFEARYKQLLILHTLISSLHR